MVLSLSYLQELVARPCRAAPICWHVRLWARTDTEGGAGGGARAPFYPNKLPCLQAGVTPHARIMVRRREQSIDKVSVRIDKSFQDCKNPCHT